MTRRFELTEGAAYKFCEIAVVDRTTTVRAGRIGTPGEAKAKQHPSPKAAQSAAELLIWERLAEGFREVPVPAAVPGGAANPTPTSEVVKLPPGDKPIRVVLERHGETLTHELHEGRVSVGGEPVSFGSMSRARDHLERILAEDQAAGWRVVKVAAFKPKPHETLVAPSTTMQGRTWVVKLEDEGPQLVPRKTVVQILDELATRAPQALHLRCGATWPGTHWEKAITGRTFPSLTAFVFDEPSDTEDRQRDNSLGDLGATLIAMPNLERLFAVGDLRLGPTTHGAATALVLGGNPHPRRLLEGLGQSVFPRLEHLALSLSADEGPLAPRVAASLRTLAAERLARVDLVGLDSVPDTLAALAALGEVGWSTLMLHGESDEDALVEAVEHHAAWLGRFATIGLPVGDTLSEEAQSRIAALLPRLTDTSAAESLFLPTTYEGWLA
jgi:predicted DNA-binding WGR domain protein